MQTPNKAIASLNFATAGSPDKLEPGDIDIPKDMTCDAFRCEFTANIANSGGNTTLTAASKTALLACFTLNLITLASKWKPYTKTGFDVLRRLWRIVARSEIEGYTDTSTGLG